MAYEEAPPPSEGFDKAVRATRNGCGCLSMASAVFGVLAYLLSRVT